MILLETKHILDIYMQAIPSLKSQASDFSSSPQIDEYAPSLQNIRTLLEKALDSTSVDAAKKQRELLAALAEWSEHVQFLCSHHTLIFSLEKACAIAHSWAELPAPKKGLARIFSKSPKDATPGDYVTYEEAIQEHPHAYMLTCAKYDGLMKQLQALKEHITEAKVKNEKKHQQIASNLHALHQQRDALEEKLNELLEKNRALPSQDCEEAAALHKEIVHADNELCAIKKMMEDMQSHLSLLSPSLLDEVSAIYDIISSHQENIQCFVSIASGLSWEAIHKTIDGCASVEEAQQIAIYLEILERMNTENLRMSREISEEPQERVLSIEEREAQANTEREEAALFMDDLLSPL